MAPNRSKHDDVKCANTHAMVRDCVLLISGVISSGWKKTDLPGVDVPVDGVDDRYCCSIPRMIVILNVLVSRDDKRYEANDVQN